MAFTHPTARQGEKGRIMSDEYRNNLIQAEQKSQDDYDKAIISLSGGALGISLVFYKDVIGSKIPVVPSLLVWSWGIWAASIAAVVLSYFLSRLALRKAIEQTDRNDFSGGVGGLAANLTNYTNALSGIFFVVGISFFIAFAAQNIEGKSMSDESQRIEKKGYTPPPPPPPKTREPLTEGVIPPPPPPPPAPQEQNEP